MTTDAIAPTHSFAAGTFFLLRTPLLPADDLLQWSHGMDGIADANWEDLLARSRAVLRSVLQRPEVRNALLLSGDSVEHALAAWLTDPYTKKGRKAERTLVRYFQRMSSRPTPFGLFSGCTLGLIDASQTTSSLRIGGVGTYRRSTRLDFEYLCRLAAVYEADTRIALQLRYHPNTTLVQVGTAWQYVETRGGVHFSRHLVRIASDPFLNAVIAAAAASGTTVDALAAVICSSDPLASVEHDEAREYVQALISNDVLTSSVWPALTGGDARSQMEAELGTHTESSEAMDAAATLGLIGSILALIDAEGIRQPPSAYLPLRAQLSKLGIPASLAQAVQVDMFKPAGVRLGPTIISEIERSLTLLCQLTYDGEPDELQWFRDAFVRRYERAWIPLVEALDDEGGIPFGAPPGDGEGALRHSTNSGNRALNALQHLLLRKMATGDGLRRRELILEESELAQLQGAVHNPPDACEVIATIVADRLPQMAGDKFQVVLRVVSGPPAARLSARFCHLSSELEERVRQCVHLDEREDTEAIYAEVVHLPEARLGNILQRPSLRAYEIPLLGNSGAPAERSISVSELLVTVADDGTIMLFCPRLQRRVIPRVTNAHGFLNPSLLPLYRFLCYLQFQRVAGLWFGWGALNSLPFLPRVRVGRTVLACARWRIEGTDLDKLRHPDRRTAFEAVQEIRRQRDLPRWVSHLDGDTNLLVDLGNPLSVDAFTGLLAGKSSVILEEQYPSYEDLCVEGPEGRFSTN